MPQTVVRSQTRRKISGRTGNKSTLSTSSKKQSRKKAGKVTSKLTDKPGSKIGSKIANKVAGKTAKSFVPSKPKVLVGETPSLPEIAATSGKPFELGKGKPVVLYFYPKDNTPGCTLEGQDFTKLYSQFQKEGAEIYGISRDSLKSHESFKSKMCFPFELLSDADEAFCKYFGVIKEKNMYGKKVLGIERSTFVFDKDGVLKREWRGVKVPDHAQEVLEFVRSLGSN